MNFKILCKKYGNINGVNYYICNELNNSHIVSKDICINSNCEKLVFTENKQEEDEVKTNYEKEINELKFKIGAIKYASNKMDERFIKNEARLHNLLEEKRHIIKYLEIKLKEYIIENERLQAITEEIC
ncbi:MAG: hypothetical protein M0R03_03810 [Novosphingobium sp.]|nr:hypothetical protein [Novosphingobium sp.]